MFTSWNLALWEATVEYVMLLESNSQDLKYYGLNLRLDTIGRVLSSWGISEETTDEGAAPWGPKAFGRCYGNKLIINDSN